MATEVISNINQKIIGSVTNIPWLKVGGWILFIVLLVAGGFLFYNWYKNKKIFNKIIKIFEIVGTNYVPTMEDQAKVVKIGTGGFEILYLKKLKCYRIGYGGRVGKSTYYFFIGQDGIWYNGMLSANVNAINQAGGLVPIVTTNPLMRGQYTALEKSIEALHKEKKTFMQEYGMWVLGAGFIVIIGVFAWLIFREMSPIMGQVTSTAQILGDVAIKQAEASDRFVEAIERLDIILDRAGIVLTNQTGGGLVPI